MQAYQSDAKAVRTENHKKYDSIKNRPLAVTEDTTKQLVTYVIPAWLHINIAVGTFHYKWFEVLARAIDSVIVGETDYISFSAASDRASGTTLAAFTTAANKVGIVKTQYHGGSLEGNHCRRLFVAENADKLVLSIRESIVGAQELNDEQRQKCFEFLRYIRQSIDLFTKVRTGVLGSETIKSFQRMSIQRDINSFVEKYKESYNFTGKMNITPKLHVLLTHTTEFLGSAPLNLGLLCEEGNEALHKENKILFNTVCASLKKNKLLKLLQRSTLRRLH